MPLRGARAHIQRADRAITELQESPDFDQAQESFIDALTYLNGVLSAAEADTAGMQGAKPYWTKVVGAAAKDPLIKWARNARNAGLKRGEQQLGFVGATISELIVPQGEVLPGERLVLDAGGIYAESGSGAGQRRRINVSTDYAFEYEVPNAPTEHLGQPISDATAVGLLLLCRAYVVDLIDAAESHFGVSPTE